MEAAVHETGQIPDVKALADRLAIYDARDATDPSMHTSTAERVA
jgi:hypothetical protein